MKAPGGRLQLNTVISIEEQRSVLPGSMESIRSSSLASDDYIFSEETMQSLRELGAVLQEIHGRLIAEGYILRNGQFIKQYDGTNITGSK